MLDLILSHIITETPGMSAQPVGGLLLCDTGHWHIGTML